MPDLPNMPEQLSTAGLVEVRLKSLDEFRAGDIVRRDNSLDAYAVDNDKPEKFRQGPAVVASRRVLIDNPQEWRVYRPKK